MRPCLAEVVPREIPGKLEGKLVEAPPLAVRAHVEALDPARSAQRRAADVVPKIRLDVDLGRDGQRVEGDRGDFAPVFDSHAIPYRLPIAQHAGEGNGKSLTGRNGMNVMAGGGVGGLPPVALKGTISKGTPKTLATSSVRSSSGPSS